jgi:hypothetical protein
MTVQKATQFLKRLAECVGRMRGQPSVVEYVVRLSQRPEYLKGGISTRWLLANPVPDSGGVIRWTAVSPSIPEFRDVVSDRLRRGYLPLGIIDVEAPFADVYVDVVPEPYRNDFVQFAKMQLQLTYLTITGQISPTDSWVGDDRVTVHGDRAN